MRIIIISFFVIFAMGMNASCHREISSYLYPIPHNQSYTVIDEYGKIYSCAHDYQSIIVSSVDNSVWGHTQNNWYNITLEETGGIREELVPEFTGYISVSPLGDDLFSLGCLSEEGFGEYKLFDKKGIFANSSLISECNISSPLSDERLCFYTREMNYGICDRSGKIIVAPDRGYKYIMPFNEGYAGFYKEIEGELRWGFLDVHGKETSPPQYRIVMPYSGGIAAVARANDGRFIYIKGDNSPCFEQNRSFNIASTFSENLAPVQDEKNSLWYYIDRKGNNVTNAEFVTASSYREGIALVKKSGNTLLAINLEGKTLFQYNTNNESEKLEFSKFYGPLSLCAESPERYFYLNKQGKLIWEGQVSQQEALVLQTYLLSHK